MSNTAVAIPAPRDELCTLSAAELARRIASGSLSSRVAVEAHIRRIEEVNPLLNAVILPRFDAARSEAAAADAAVAAGQSLGPLHGVPITIKECFHLEGTPSSIGVESLRAETFDRDGVLVGRLRAAGAIVLGKTNLPQWMLFHETENPIYGRTNNPWNVERSPGGSSGGESAIIAAGGSPLGLANDLGGSIRQPAHSCGICGIKTTLGRLTLVGSRNGLTGLQALASQPGPMARSVEDLWLALQVLHNPADENRAAFAPALYRPLADPFSMSVEALTIGIVESVPFFQAAPAMRRAVREAADTLRRRGATIVPFEIPDFDRSMANYLGLMGATGGRSLDGSLQAGELDPRIRRLLRIGRIGPFARRWLARLLPLFGQHHAAFLLRSTGVATRERLELLTQTQRELGERMLATLSDRRIDAILLPPHALPALRHGMSAELVSAACYCYFANLLGWPAGVVPITRIGSREESDRRASWDREECLARQVERGSANLPVGVQILAPPWREDLVLALMQAASVSDP